MVRIGNEESAAKVGELLTSLKEQGIISEVDEAHIADKLERMNKLNAQIAAHHVWQGSDGKWHTHFYVGGKRKKKTRNKYEDIMADVKEYYEAMEDNPTVNDLFLEWLEIKLATEDIIESTYSRYMRAYERSFARIKDVHVKSISEYNIEDFVLTAICEDGLTKKAYENFRTDLYGIFEYAKHKKYVDFSIREVVREMKIPQKKFADPKCDPDKRFFSNAEIADMEEVIAGSPDIINLSILLNFRIGLRIGELTAIKWKDVDLNCGEIHICRTETSYDDPATGKHVYEVRDGAKTYAGERYVTMPDSAVRIMKAIRRINPFTEFVFERNGERVRTYMIRQRVYRICDITATKRKPTHSIRRTCATEMIDAGMPDGQITSQLGHTDIKTTRDCYYGDRSSREERRRAVNGVFH